MGLAAAGGFRTTLLRCGPPRPFRGVGILANLARAPCVSGGWITAGVIAWSRAPAPDGHLPSLKPVNAFRQ